MFVVLPYSILDVREQKNVPRKLYIRKFYYFRVEWRVLALDYQCIAFNFINLNNNITMTDEKLIIVLNRFKKHLNSRDFAIVSEYLKKVNDDAFVCLQNIELKDPIIGIILAWSLGAFGGGAFYVKKIGYGIVQLLLYIFYFISMFGYFFESLGNDFGVCSIIFICLGICVFVMFLVSLICVVKWIKEYNYKKIMEILPLL